MTLPLMVTRVPTTAQVGSVFATILVAKLLSLALEEDGLAELGAGDVLDACTGASTPYGNGAAELWQAVTERACTVCVVRCTQQ